MSTLLEKLNKEELVGVITNNSDASWELVDMCIKNQFIIPDVVLNNYLKDHPIFSEKEIPSTGLYILVKKWYLYAYNLLRKNIDIPEIVLKAISKHMGLSSNLIGDFINARKDVPEILIKLISSSPNDSYWVARYFIESNKKVPEILNRSIAKEPMLLQTYKQFLREIEVEKKVKEAYASKEEVKESVIVNEKLDKEELLNSAVLELHSIMDLVAYWEDNDIKMPDNENMHQTMANLGPNRYEIGMVVSTNPIKKINVWARVWYAILFLLEGRKVPDIINQSIAKDKGETIEYYEYLRDNGLEIPEVIQKSYLNYKEKINESSVINEKLDKEELLKAAANDPFESFALAKKYVEKYKEPPEELVRGLTKRKKEEWTGSNYNHSVAYAMLAIDHDVKVPNYVLKSILESEYDAYDYLIKMIKDKRIIPDDFLNSYFEKYYSAPEFLEQKPIFGQDQGFSKDVEIWYDYTEILLNKNVEIPENIIDAVSKSIYYSERLIDHLLYKKRDVPEILLKSVSLSPQYSYYSATHFIEYGKEVPEILNQVITKDPTYQYMYNEFLSERKEKKKINESVVISEKLDKEELVSAFLKDANVTYKYVQKNFLNKNQEPPEEFINAMAQSAYVSENYFKDIVKRKMNVPDVIKKGILKDSQSTLKTWQEFGEFMPMNDIVNSISQSPYKSIEFYKIQKEKNKKVPPIILKSIISNEYASYDLAKIFLEENKPVPDVIIRGFISRPQSIFTFAMEVLKKGFDLPKIILRIIADNADNYMGLSGYADFDTILFSHLKQNKKIPDILLDAFNKKEDYDIARFCMLLGRHHIKIPDRILNTLIEKTPKHGVTRYLGAVSYDILSYYLIKSPESVANPEEVLKTIPTRLYQYAIGLDMAGIIHTKKLIKGFLTVFGKVPDDFKQAIIDEYKKYGNTIPKEIADTTGIKQSKAINEKLEKDELLDAVIKDANTSYGLIIRSVRDKREFPEVLYKGLTLDPTLAEWEASRLIENKKDVPDILIKSIASKTYTSLSFARGFWEKFGKEPPEIILYGISKSHEYSLYYARDMIKSNREIPEIITKGISKNYFSSALYADKLKEAGREVPDIILKTNSEIARLQHQEYEKNKSKTIEEKLDKEELMSAVLSDSEASYGYAVSVFLNKGQKPPNEFIDTISKSPLYSSEYAKLSLEKRIKIPKDLFKSILKNPDVSYSFALFLKSKKKKVPDSLLDSIANKPELASFYASTLIKKFGKKDIPEKILKSFKFLNGSNAVRFASDIVDFIEIPDIVLDSVIRYNNHRSALELAKILHKKNKKIPEKILGALSWLDYLEFLIVSNIEIPKFVSDKIQEYPLAYAELLLKHNRDVPQNILELAAKEKNSRRSLKYAFHLINIRQEVPEIILKHIAENSSWDSYELIERLMFKDKKIPYILIQGISDSLSLSVEFAKKIIHKNIEIPQIIMDKISENKNALEEIEYELEKRKKRNERLKQFSLKTITEKLDKNELLDAVIKDKYQVNQMVFNFAANDKKIPEKLVEYISQNWNPSYMYQIAIDIIRYSNYDVPEMILRGIAKSNSLSNEMALLYKNHYLEIPDVIMNALTPKQKEFYNSVWWSKQKPITEKLNKSELLDTISKNIDKHDILDFASSLSYADAKLPDNILKIITERPMWASDYVIDLLKKDKNILKRENIDILLNSVSKFSDASHNLSKHFIMNDIEVPDIILNSVAKSGNLSRDLKLFYDQHMAYWVKKKKIPDVILKAHEANKQRLASLGLSDVYLPESKETITEKLDKNDLLGVIQKDYDGFIQIMDYFFRKKKEYPPEEFLKMAVETDEASRIFAEYCLEMKKDIPDEVIKKVAETPRSAYTIAALMILEERKVPEILIKSINSDPLSKKHFEQFAKNQKYPIHIPTLYYAKI